MSASSARELIEAAFADRKLLDQRFYRDAVINTVAALDRGELRVAEKKEGAWQTNAWVKQAILLYFGITEMKAEEAGPLAFHDKIPVKRDLDKAGVRVAPPGAVRYGAYLEKGAIVSAGYVNTGAWVGSGTMVDTWATVGSGAQVGRNVHLSGGAVVGGGLEPPAGTPAIIEDNCFLGSRSIVAEGAIIEEEAVLGANVVITGSTPIIDVTGEEEVVHKGRVPARSVVIPGTRTKEFPAGSYGVPCALIVGKRDESTDKKASLAQALRDFSVAV